MLKFVQSHTQGQSDVSTARAQARQQNETVAELLHTGLLRYNTAVPPDHLTPSPELVSAVKVERERLDEVMTSLRAKYAALEAELGSVYRDLRALTARDIELARFLGEELDDLVLDFGERELRERDEEDEPGLDRERRGGVRSALRPRRRRAPTRGKNGGLRGAAIRAAAVKAALADADPGRPRHYREWLSLVQVIGERIDGRDPAATLLTQLSRCPLVTRAPHPGVYRLDRDALVHLRARRAALRAEADERVTTTDNRDYDVIDLAQALAAVEANVRRIDRSIEEATQLVERLDAKGFFTRPGPETENRLHEPQPEVAPPPRAVAA